MSPSELLVRIIADTLSEAEANIARANGIGEKIAATTNALEELINLGIRNIHIYRNDQDGRHDQLMAAVQTRLATMGIEGISVRTIQNIKPKKTILGQPNLQDRSITISLPNIFAGF